MESHKDKDRWTVGERSEFVRKCKNCLHYESRWLNTRRDVCMHQPVNKLTKELFDEWLKNELHNLLNSKDGFVVKNVKYKISCQKNPKK